MTLNYQYSHLFRMYMLMRQVGSTNMLVVTLSPDGSPVTLQLINPRRLAHSLHLHPRRRREETLARPGYLIEVDAIAVTAR